MFFQYVYPMCIWFWTCVPLRVEGGGRVVITHNKFVINHYLSFSRFWLAKKLKNFPSSCKRFFLCCNFLNVVLAVWPCVCSICSRAVFECFSVSALVFLALLSNFLKGKKNAIFLCVFAVCFPSARCVEKLCSPNFKIVACAVAVLSARLFFLCFHRRCLPFLLILINYVSWLFFLCVCFFFFRAWLMFLGVYLAC